MYYPPPQIQRNPLQLTLVCGPPGSGKTYHVNQHRQPGDLTWDLDVVVHAVTGQPHTTDPILLKLIGEMRQGLFNSLHRYPPAGRVWIIQSCPTRKERAWFRNTLGANVVMLNPGHSVCIERVLTTGRAGQIVDNWYARYEPGE